MKLGGPLLDAALRLAGSRPQEWLCPVCGAVLADEDLSGERPPVHEHRGRSVELVKRAQL